MHDFTTHHTLSYRNKPLKKLKKGPFWVLAITLSVIITVLIGRTFYTKSQDASNREVKGVKNQGASINGKEFISQIEDLTTSVSGTVSVNVYDLNNKKEYGLHPQTVITAASVNKIAILASLYYLAGNKEVDLEKLVVPQAEDIQDYGTGSIRYDEPGTPYSIKTLARLMMEKSDNTASYILANHIVGIDKIQSLIDSWGLTQTSIADNTTSAKDMGILMIKMYKGEITNNSLTSEMLNFMEKSDFDDRLPVGIPENVTIYHKTGDEVNKIHDVGIIDLPGRPYYLGVLTSDMTDEGKAKEVIGEISKIVYKEMTGTK